MLPGAIGTIALNGFDGQVCASAPSVVAIRPSATTSIKSIGFIDLLLAPRVSGGGFAQQLWPDTV